ncbi:MAG: two-component regulator propeller domain-containing protein [Bacteroidales bacterium]
MKKTLLPLLFLFSLTINAQWNNYDNSNNPVIKSNAIRSVAIDDEGILWFGTSDGLISFDGDKWLRYTQEQHSIAGNSINQVNYISTNGSLILSTNNGSNEVDLQGGFLVSSTWQTDNSGIYDNVVYSAGVNPTGIKSFGTAKGFSVFTGSVWSPIQNLAAIDSINLANNPVISINSTPENTFISSDGKGIYLTANEVDGLSFVTNWVFPYNIPTSDNIKATFVDSEGNQWYGTDMGAVYHAGIEAQAGWSDPYTTAQGLPDNQVNAIIEDSYGHVWFGTENGIAVKKADDTWTTFSEADGLIDNRVKDIIESNDNRIWIATEEGISSFTPSWVSNNITLTNSYFNLRIHPNPASEGTWIKYNLPDSGPLKLNVYDISGKLINTLKNEFGVAGEHEIFWNVKDENDIPVPAGIYFLRIESRNLISSRKIVVLQ